MAGRIAQLAECLPSNHEVLLPLPSKRKNMSRKKCPDEGRLKKNELCARCRWLTPVILATWETEIRRITSRQIVRETLLPKWSGGVAQLVDCLLCKCEARSSNPNTAKEKKRNKKKRKHNKNLSKRKIFSEKAEQFY
jgi:hypothetical protein